MLFSIFLFLGSSRVDLNDSQLKIVLVYFIYPPVHMPSETSHFSSCPWKTFKKSLYEDPAL